MSKHTFQHGSTVIGVSVSCTIGCRRSGLLLLLIVIVGWLFPIKKKFIIILMNKIFRKVWRLNSCSCILWHYRHKSWRSHLFSRKKAPVLYKTSDLQVRVKKKQYLDLMIQLALILKGDGYRNWVIFGVCITWLDFVGKKIGRSKKKTIEI